MQDTKFAQTKHKSRAHRLLSNSLQELNGQKDSRDTRAVAEKLNITVRTVETYLAGNVAALETGRQIFTTLRTMIIAREKIK
jgi:hypothetical protein